MPEVLTIAVLAAGGTWFLSRSGGLSDTVSLLLGPVTALAGFVAVVTLSVSMLKQADPLLAALVTLVLLVGFGIRTQSGRSARSEGLVSLWSFVSVGAVGLLATAINATRLTQDSLSYLAVADILTEPDALVRLRSHTIEARNVSTSALQTLGRLSDRPYAEAVTPIVTVFGMLAMLWLLYRALATRPRRTRWLLIGTTAIFCLLAGRPLYDAFYINSHGPVMVWMFALVVAGYYLVTERSRGWAAVVAIVAPAILVARPEGPILVALAMLPVLTSRSDAFPRRWLLMVPTTVVGVAWFTAVAIEHPDLTGLSPSRPAVAALAGVLGLLGIGVIRSRGALSRQLAILPWGLAAALAGVFALGAVADPDRTAASIEATVVNLTTAGGWGLTWPVATILSVVALSLPQPPQAHLLLQPIAGFSGLYWASIVLRDGGYRIGTGDSGNRMLAHVFLIVVFYTVFTISQRARDGTRGDQP